MHKTIIAVALAAAFAAPVFAEEAAPAAQEAAAPAGPHTFTGNMTIASDYRFRGISQTYKGPAIQGGVDYSHESGLYLGNWNSNVSSAVYTGGAGIEMDFYGGYKKAFGDFGLDVGYLFYYYPSAAYLDKKFNNQEVYVAGSWKFVSLKYSRAISDYFGLNSEQTKGGYFVNKDTGAFLGDNGGSKGSSYTDLTVAYPLTEKLTLNAHVGRALVKNYGELSYTDWKLGANYDLAGWSLGANYVATNAKKEWYYTGGSKGNKETGTGTVVLSLGKTF